MDFHTNTIPPAPKRRSTTPLILFLACLLLPLAVYLSTLAPTVYTFDSAEFATGAFCLGIIHPPGYPFYLLLAKLFTFVPIGDIAYRVNLMSAVFGALTVSLLYLVCYRLTGRATVSASAALLFAFSRFFWREAVIAEIYTLNTALLSILFLVLLADARHRSNTRIGLAGLVFGLGLANHISAVLLVPSLLFWAIARRETVIRVLTFASLAVVGLAFYLYLPIRYAANPPLNYAGTYLATDLTTLAGIWSWVTAETFHQFMRAYSLSELLGETVSYLGWLWSNFLGAGLVLGVVGILAMLQRERSNLMFFGVAYLAYTLFFINYRVVDKDTMFTVSYLVWTIFVAFGASSLLAYLGTSRPQHVLVSGLLAAVALVSLLLNYPSIDQSRNTMARDFAGQLLDQAGPSAFIITEWTWATPLEYLQIVERRRPDVTIYDRGLAGLGVWNQLRRQGIPDEQASMLIEQALVSVVSREIATRPVYATEYDQALANSYEFLSLGRYYQLIPRPAMGSRP